MKPFRLAALAAATLALQSCFFAPGKFDSTLGLRRDGRFTFSYTGEVLFLEGPPGSAAVTSEQCYGPVPAASGAAPVVTTVPVSAQAEDADTAEENADPGAMADGDSAPFEPRDCTPAEKAERTAARESKAKQEAELMGAFIGFNPQDPASVQAYIGELRRYPGWRSVTHKGGNRFEIDYRISGTADRDFLFPMFDNVIVHTPFLTMRPRSDGSAEVRAPAFGGNGVGSWMALMGMGGPAPSNDAEAFTKLLKSTEGTFTLVTDGDIRTNNTAEGPTTRGRDKVLSWKVSALSKEAPRALVQLR